jgi:hypothetical protein
VKNAPDTKRFLGAAEICLVATLLRSGYIIDSQMRVGNSKGLSGDIFLALTKRSNLISYFWPVHLLEKDNLPSARRQGVFGYTKQSATVSVGILEALDMTKEQSKPA